MNMIHENNKNTKEKRDFTELEERLRAGREAYQKIPVPEGMEERVRKAAERTGKLHGFRIPAAVAAAVAVLIILPNTGADMAYAMGNIPVVGRLFQAVTFRDYQYESDRFNADVEVPQIVVEDVEKPDQESEESSQKLQETIEQVNFDIDAVTNQLIEEFKESAELGESYGGLEIHHEIVTDNEQYFTLKLSIYQAAGSGTESYKLYTIDKRSGRQVHLGDLFLENSGYNELMSDNIRNQMRTLMAEDEMNMYWVDNTDIPEWNWEGIKEDQNFYFDDEGNIVIVFDEYEVAPGYMGAQEFVVEREVFGELLK